MTVEPRVLGGRYELDSLLGQGGMADVYLGTDRVLGRRVAVKVLGQQYARDATFVMRFRREAQAAAALNHANVVGVFDTGTDDGTHYIVMEFVEGRTLARIIRDRAPLRAEAAARVTESVAAALAFAHRAGLVHRDVKPANIMITPSGEVKVMDFGIARAAAAEGLTQTATVMGTASYFSPEQAQGLPVDARSDIYSLGCVLYEMLTGAPPFAAETAVAVAYKHVKEDPEPPSAQNPDVPPALDSVVMKCLAKNPDNRYASAEALREDLQRFRDGQSVMATPLLEPTQMVAPASSQTAVLRTPLMPRRQRRWVPILVFSLLGLLLLGGLFFLAKSLLANNSNLVTVQCPVGKSQAAASDALHAQGFQPAVGQQIPSDRYAAGQVASCTPTGPQPKGSRITLQLSSGKAVKTTTVPNVFCISVFQAQQLLRHYNLVPVTGGTVGSATCTTPGFVERTDPPIGQSVKEGTKVTLFKVPQPSPTPTTPLPTTTTPPPTTPSPTPTTPSPTSSTP